MNELFLCTPGSIGSIVCLRQSPTMGALPPTPRSFPHWANGLFAKSVAARGKPCRNTEVSAPLATSTAPVALRQSRILRTMPDSYLKSPQHQSLRAQSCRNPVLLRLRCLVLNRLCLVLLRPRQIIRFQYCVMHLKSRRATEPHIGMPQFLQQLSLLVVMSC